MKDIKYEIVAKKCEYIRDQANEIIEMIEKDKPGHPALVDIFSDKIEKAVKDIQILHKAAYMESMAELDRE